MAENQQVHCTRCWGRPSSEVEKKDFVKSDENRDYHRKCFVCDKCEKSLVDTFYLHHLGGLFCIKCFEARWSLECKKCGKVMTNELHKMDGFPHHFACTECTWCGRPLDATCITSGPDRFCTTCHQVKEMSKTVTGSTVGEKAGPSTAMSRSTRQRSKPAAPPPPPPTPTRPTTSPSASGLIRIADRPSSPPPPLPPSKSVRFRTSLKKPAPLPIKVTTTPVPNSIVDKKSPTVSPGECTICFEKQVDSVCIPCGHMSMCYVCATNYQERSKEHSVCPICRSPAQSFRTYFASS